MGAFEGIIVDGVIFDLDRQPLISGIERWAAGDRPGFHDAVPFESQVVVQPARCMALHHESKLSRRSANFTCWLGRAGKVALFAIPLQGGRRTAHRAAARFAAPRFAAAG